MTVGFPLSVLRERPTSSKRGNHADSADPKADKATDIWALPNK